jgi:hypothetical protein
LLGPQTGVQEGAVDEHKRNACPLGLNICSSPSSLDEKAFHCYYPGQPILY